MFESPARGSQRSDGMTARTEPCVPLFFDAELPLTVDVLVFLVELEPEQSQFCRRVSRAEMRRRRTLRAQSIMSWVSASATGAAAASEKTPAIARSERRMVREEEKSGGE